MHFRKSCISGIVFMYMHIFDTCIKSCQNECALAYSWVVVVSGFSQTQVCQKTCSETLLESYQICQWVCKRLWSCVC
jgi:hypothetical protein